MKQNKAAQRLERIVRTKLEKGWNCFSREEVEALVGLLYDARRAKRNAQQRVHTAHGDTVAWHFEGDVGLHADRPAPVGARNLFEKPENLDFVRGWRIPKGFKVPGYQRNQEGCLVRHTNRKPKSPNDVIRELQDSLKHLSSAYRGYREELSTRECPESPSLPDVGDDADGSCGDGINPTVLSEQSDTCGEALPVDE